MKKMSNRIVFYGFGDLGCCLIGYMISNYLSFFSSVHLGIPLATVGAVLLAVQVWDAVNDILVGHAMDKVSPEQEHARPWIRRFMLPCCCSAVLIFLCPASFPVVGKVFWLLVCYGAYVLFYTCVNLPYGVLMPLMTQDPDERVRLCTARYTGAYAGMLAVSAAALPLVNRLGGENEARGYPLVTALFAIIGLLCFVLVLYGCREETRYAPIPSGQKASPLLQNLQLLCHSRAWLTVIALTFIYWLRYPFYSTVMPYYYKYYLNLNEARSSVMYTAGILLGLVVLWALPPLEKKLGRRPLFAAGCLCSMVCMAAGYLARNSEILSVIFFAGGYSAESVPCALLLTLLAESIEADCPSGTSLDGTGFAVGSFCTKAAGGLGSFLALLLLDAGQLDLSSAAQSSCACTAIRIIFWLIPAFLSLVMAVLVRVCPSPESTAEEGRAL